jgi:hypothetical protein
MIKSYGMSALSAIHKSLTKKDDMYFLAYVEVMSVLGKYWPERFTSTEFLVLSFLVNRTLLFRKKAEVIPRRHFVDGVESGAGVTCMGVGVSENSLMKAVASLAQQDYVHIHCFKLGQIESTPRLYELNYDALVAGYDLGEVQNMLKRGRKTTRVVEENDGFYDDLPPPKFKGGGGSNLGGITEVLHTSISSSKEEESAAPQPKKFAGLRVGKNHKVPRAIDCITTHATGSARERLEEMKETSTVKRTTRLATVRTLPDRRWEVKDLQALLDEARVRAGVSIPRVMATAKGTGVLHKRMKEAEVTEPLEFFTWALKNWATVANANRRAKANQLKDTKAVNSEMAMIPNFNDLSYRFPYILVFFNDRKFVEVQAVEQKEVQTREFDNRVEAQRVAIDRRRQTVREQDLHRREQDRKAEQEFVERRRRARPSATVDDDDEPLPEFKEREWRG